MPKARVEVRRPYRTDASSSDRRSQLARLVPVSAHHLRQSSRHRGGTYSTGHRREKRAAHADRRRCTGTFSSPTSGGFGGLPSPLAPGDRCRSAEHSALCECSSSRTHAGLAQKGGATRMKQRRLTSAPNTLQPGYYIFWQQRTYRVIALDPDNALVLHVEPIPEAPRTTLSLLDLCASPQAGASAPLFAPTQTALHEQLEELYGITSTVFTHDLPDNYVIKARIIITVVETARRLLAENERCATLRGEPISRTQAIGRALATVNKTTI